MVGAVEGEVAKGFELGLDPVQPGAVVGRVGELTLLSWAQFRTSSPSPRKPAATTATSSTGPPAKKAACPKASSAMTLNPSPGKTSRTRKTPATEDLEPPRPHLRRRRPVPLRQRRARRHRVFAAGPDRRRPADHRRQRRRRRLPGPHRRGPHLRAGAECKGSKT